MTDINSIRDRIQKADKYKEELTNGLKYSFSPEYLPELLAFVKHEEKCCVFLDFSVQPSPSNVDCVVTLKPEESHEIHTVKEIISTLFSPS